MKPVEGNVYTLIADVALIQGRSVLLVKYKDSSAYDGQTGWFLPDASIKYLEHPDRAAARLLKQQLGLIVQAPELDHIESFRGNDGSWHLAFHYKVEMEQPPKVEPGEAIAFQQWFPLEQLPSKDQVAHHGWANSILNKMHS
ncbi:MAG: NUDIX domain-containing protein [Anaerolineales bacterium]